MAQLIVRNLDNHLVQLLKERAAASGRSAEEEHRRILQTALESQGFAQHLTSFPEVGEDDDFARRPDLPRAVEL